MPPGRPLGMIPMPEPGTSSSSFPRVSSTTGPAISSNGETSEDEEGICASRMGAALCRRFSDAARGLDDPAGPPAAAGRAVL